MSDFPTYMRYSDVRDVKNVTITKTNPPHREKITLGYATLVPDDDYPDTLGARWTVKWGGKTLGTIRRITVTPMGQQSAGTGRRPLTRKLAPRTAWNATRPDGTQSPRPYLATRNDALRFLLGD